MFDVNVSEKRAAMGLFDVYLAPSTGGWASLLSAALRTFIEACGDDRFRMFTRRLLLGSDDGRFSIDTLFIRLRFQSHRFAVTCKHVSLLVDRSSAAAQFTSALLRTASPLNPLAFDAAFDAQSRDVASVAFDDDVLLSATDVCASARFADALDVDLTFATIRAVIDFDTANTFISAAPPPRTLRGAALLRELSRHYVLRRTRCSKNSLIEAARAVGGYWRILAAAIERRLTPSEVSAAAAFEVSADGEVVSLLRARLLSTIPPGENQSYQNLFLNQLAILGAEMDIGTGDGTSPQAATPASARFRADHISVVVRRCYGSDIFAAEFGTFVAKVEGAGHVVSREVSAASFQVNDLCTSIKPQVIIHHDETSTAFRLASRFVVGGVPFRDFSLAKLVVDVNALFVRRLFIAISDIIFEFPAIAAASRRNARSAIALFDLSLRFSSRELASASKSQLVLRVPLPKIVFRTSADSAALDLGFLQILVNSDESHVFIASWEKAGLELHGAKLLENFSVRATILAQDKSDSAQGFVKSLQGMVDFDLCGISLSFPDVERLSALAAAAREATAGTSSAGQLFGEFAAVANFATLRRVSSGVRKFMVSRGEELSLRLRATKCDANVQVLADARIVATLANLVASLRFASEELSLHSSLDFASLSVRKSSAAHSSELTLTDASLKANLLELSTRNKVAAVGGFSAAHFAVEPHSVAALVALVRKYAPPTVTSWPFALDASVRISAVTADLFSLRPHGRSFASLRVESINLDSRAGLHSLRFACADVVGKESGAEFQLFSAHPPPSSSDVEILFGGGKFNFLAGDLTALAVLGWCFELQEVVDFWTPPSPTPPSDDPLLFARSRSINVRIAAATIRFAEASPYLSSLSVSAEGLFVAGDGVASLRFGHVGDIVLSAVRADGDVNPIASFRSEASADLSGSRERINVTVSAMPITLTLIDIDTIISLARGSILEDRAASRDHPRPLILIHSRVDLSLSALGTSLRVTDADELLFTFAVGGLTFAATGADQSAELSVAAIAADGPRGGSSLRFDADPALTATFQSEGGVQSAALTLAPVRLDVHPDLFSLGRLFEGVTTAEVAAAAAAPVGGGVAFSLAVPDIRVGFSLDGFCFLAFKCGVRYSMAQTGRIVKEQLQVCNFETSSGGIEGDISAAISADVEETSDEGGVVCGVSITCAN